jgi:hypothetical protein
MAANDNFLSEALELTAAAKVLLENEETLLTSEEDCAYFRELVRAKKEKPAPPLPAPAPVIKAPPREPRPKGRGMVGEGLRTPPKPGFELPGPEGPGFWSLDETRINRSPFTEDLRRPPAVSRGGWHFI